MAKHREVRWQVFKDYTNEFGTNFVDGDAILYADEAGAKQRLRDFEEGCDKSWFIPGETDGFLYVDQITL